MASNINPLLNGDHFQSYFDRNEDTKNYDPEWKQSTIIYSFSDMYQRLLLPWHYQPTIQLQTVPVFGDHRLYHGGGYVLPLGRTLNNTLSILRYMNRTHWLDHNTRVVFIELTLYSANVNQFNVITIVCERTPFGNYVANANIHTAKLLFILENQSPVAVVVFVFFVLITIAYLLRLVVKLLHVKRRSFFSVFWNDLDIIIVALSISAVYMFFLRSNYVIELLRRIEDTRNNEFVSFYWAAAADELFTWWSGVLVCIATVRLWKICQFSLVCQMISATLWKARGRLIWITVVFVVVMAAISMLVNIVCGAETTFATYTQTFTSLVAMSCGFVDGLQAEALIRGGGKLFGMTAYVLVMITVNIYLLNMFVTIVCLDFSEKREELHGRRTVKLRFLEFVKMEWGCVGAGGGDRELQLKMKRNMALECGKKRLDVLQSQLHIIDKCLRTIIKKKNDAKKVKFNDDKPLHMEI